MSHPANNGRSPMKFYEYLAAGIPVFTRATDEIKRRGDVSTAYSTPDEARDATGRSSSPPTKAQDLPMC